MKPIKRKPHGGNRGAVSDAGTLPSASAANVSAPKLTGNRCQCTACGENFNGVQPFDAHRLGEHGVNRHCMTVPDMEAAGFVRNAAGFWCERAQEPRIGARARAFPARFMPRARASPPLQDCAPDSRRAEGAT